MKFVFYIITTLLVYSTTSAQLILWDKSFGGNASDILYEMTPTPDNGFILAGATHSSESGNLKVLGNGNYDYCFWKLNHAGDIEWFKTFGGTDKDLLQKVVLTTDGGFLLLGTSFSQKSATKATKNFGESDVWILKLDPAGQVQWQTTIGGTGIEKFNTIAQISNNEFIIGLTTESKKLFTEHSSKQIPETNFSLPSYGGADAVLVTIDAKKGGIKDMQRFGAKYSDEVASIHIDKNKNIYLGINSNSNLSSSKTTENIGQNDIWLLKLDQNKKVIWQKTFGGIGNDQLVSIIDFSNQITLIANSNSPSGNLKNIANQKQTSIWLFTINDFGEITTEKEVKNLKTTKATSVTNNNDQELVIAAYTSDNESLEASHFYVSALNTELNTSWEKVIENKKQNVLNNVVQLRDNSLVLAGTSNSGAMSKRSNSFGNNDMWVLKLGDEEKITKQLPQIEAYPNPVTDYVNIIIGFEYQSGSLTVFDISGRNVYYQPITNSTIPVNLKNLPQGVYILDIKTNTKAESIKIIKK